MFDDLYQLSIAALRLQNQWLLLILYLSLPPPEMPKVSYIEHVLQWLLFIEKYVLYPLTFLFGFNLSAHHYKARFTDM